MLHQHRQTHWTLSEPNRVQATRTAAMERGWSKPTISTNGGAAMAQPAMPGAKSPTATAWPSLHTATKAQHPSTEGFLKNSFQRRLPAHLRWTAVHTSAGNMLQTAVAHKTAIVPATPSVVASTTLPMRPRKPMKAECRELMHQAHPRRQQPKEHWVTATTSDATTGKIGMSLCLSSKKNPAIAGFF